MSTPSSRMLPLVALSSPASRPSRVLLPLPDGPMIATNWPRGIERSMPRRISTRCVGVAIARVSRMTSMMPWESVGATSVMIMAVPLKWMLLVAATVALIACGSREQSKPQEQTQVAQPAPQALQKPDTRPVIAAFGDSLSAGFGVEPGKSFPDDIQRMLDAKGYPYHVVNLGVSGDTTTDGVERLPAVLAVHPAIVLLEFGGNDGLRGLPVTSTQKNLAIMIE